jgi:O-antigen/teichoic acid export membrane protein
LGSLAPIDTLQLDVLLTTSFLGATAAGLYYVATSVGLLVRVWGTTLGALSLPRVAAAAAIDKAQEWTTLFVRVTVVCSGAVALLALVFARPLLTLVYGGDYAAASLLVRILAVGMFAASLRYVLGDGLRGLGQHAAATRAEMVGWLVGGLALAVFLPLWGVTGVALAVSVSYGATLVAMLQFCRKLGMRSSRLLAPTRADLAKAREMVVSALRNSDR